MPLHTRRRLLTVMGAIAGIGLFPGAGGAAALPRWRWQGTTLGAKAEIILAHTDEASVQKLIRLAVDEIERLENVFSLYRKTSEISRLNWHGQIKKPSLDLVSLLSTARHVGRLTDGAFDVTVQPLWHLYAQHFSQPEANPQGPDQALIEAAKKLVDQAAIEIGPSHIGFARPGMAITLNGIAQGYITDRVANLLRAHGVDQTLIDLGEVQACGHRPDGRPWQISIDIPGQTDPVELVDRAMATSSPKGTMFDRGGRHHHLFDPRTGRSSTGARPTSVIASSATMADALSTAFSIMPKKNLASLSKHLPDINIIQAD